MSFVTFVGTSKFGLFMGDRRTSNKENVFSDDAQKVIKINDNLIIGLAGNTGLCRSTTEQAVKRVNIESCDCIQFREVIFDLFKENETAIKELACDPRFEVNYEGGFCSFIDGQLNFSHVSVHRGTIRLWPEVILSNLRETYIIHLGSGQGPVARVFDKYSMGLTNEYNKTHRWKEIFQKSLFECAPSDYTINTLMHSVEILNQEDGHESK